MKPQAKKAEMNKHDKAKVKEFLRGLILLVDRSKEATITQSRGLDRLPDRYGIAGYKWDNSITVNIQLKGVRTRKKRGRKKTTGRFKTRGALEERIMFYYFEDKQSLNACAQLCGVSFGTAERIFKERCHDYTIDKWGSGTE